MSNRRHALLQKLSIDGVDVANEHIINFTYIEAMDLSAPAIIIQLRDEYSLLRDSGNLKKGVVVKCEIADAYHEDTEAFTDEFVIQAYPIVNSVITLEALQKDCFSLKELTVKPRFFVDKKPEQILKILLPNLKIDCPVNKGINTYHLNSGMTASRLLRKMARDFGAAVWISRGTVYFYSLKELAKKKGDKLYSKDMSKADVAIHQYSTINNEALYERTMQKKWMSQSLNKGLIKASGFNDKAVVMLPQLERWMLENQSLYIQPRLDITCLGQGELSPAMALNVEIVKPSGEGELDESVESTLLVHRISHYQENLDYLMRVQLGVVNAG